MERNQGYTILKKRRIGNTGFALGYNLGKMPPPAFKGGGFHWRNQEESNLSLIAWTADRRPLPR